MFDGHSWGGTMTTLCRKANLRSHGVLPVGSALALTFAAQGVTWADVARQMEASPLQAPAPNPWSRGLTTAALNTYLDRADVKVVIVPRVVILPALDDAERRLVELAAKAIEDALDESDKTVSVTLAATVDYVDPEIARTVPPVDADTVFVVRAHAEDPASVVVQVFDRQGTELSAFRCKLGVPIPEHVGPFPRRQAPTSSPPPKYSVRTDTSDERRFSVQLNVQSKSSAFVLERSTRTKVEMRNIQIGLVDFDVPAREREWEPICKGPCDVKVPREGLYRITGRGIRESAEFTLGTLQHQGSIYLSTASTAHRPLGIITTVLGGIAFFGGAGTLGLGLLTQNGEQLRAMGGGMMAGGAVVVLGGLLWALLPKTQVYLDSSSGRRLTRRKIHSPNLRLSEAGWVWTF